MKRQRGSQSLEFAMIALPFVLLLLATFELTRFLWVNMVFDSAVNQAMHSLGHTSTSNVRVGKTICFDVEETDTPEFRARLEKLCEDLLSNPVIEDFSCQIEA